MKKINFIYTLLGGAALLFASCGDDFLDQTPKDQYTADTYYSSDEAVRKGTEPLFNRAWFDFNRRAIVGMGSYRANDAWNPYVSAEFARFNVTSLTEDMSLAWSALYNVVTMCNATLENLQTRTTSDVSESAKNAGMGECYLMRGWAYFYLLRGWGDNFLFERNQDVINNSVRPLNTEASVLKFIIRDFRRAAQLLPESGTDHHPSRYAALAALAKALLAQSGWEENNHNDHSRNEATLKEVVSLCDSVINCGQYRLMSNYADLFKAQNNDNSETILAMRWADPNLGEWGTMNALYSDLAFPEVSDDVNCWGGSLVASTDMIDLYNQDPADSIRIQSTFFTPGGYYDYMHTTDTAYTDKSGTVHWGYIYNHNWMQCKKGVLGRKADVAPCHLAQMASPLNTYIQRLADVYLMKAEAILGNADETSDPQALEAFNTVRRRAHVHPYTKISLADIIRERRIEFCMEYFNWWDMVTWYRWKPSYMLNFFNNQQHRACEMREGDIRKNADGTFSYRCVPPGTNTWYITDPSNGHVYWNDFIATSETDNTPVAGRGTRKSYTYNYNDLVSQYTTGYQPIVLSETNIFMPYPESDVIQNHYFNEAPVEYDFGE